MTDGKWKAAEIHSTCLILNQIRLCLVNIFFFNIIFCLIEHFLKPEKDPEQVIVFLFHIELVYSMLNGGAHMLNC